MFVVVFLLALLARFDYTNCIPGQLACVPNSTFRLNGYHCYCDAAGRYTNKSCAPLNRRQVCEPGQVIKDGCYECICKNGGEFFCNNIKCVSKTNPSTKSLVTFDSSLSAIGMSCLPFRSYYVNCSICVCPSDGLTKSARCTLQSGCISQPPALTKFLRAQTQSMCLAKVMYVYPCLQCLCSDDGFFNLTECIDTCNTINSTIKCNPATFYKAQCNICYCPKDGTRNDELCQVSDCASKHSVLPLQNILEKINKCEPHKFSQPKCFYCDCAPEGIVNDKSCTEMLCMKALTGDDYIANDKCSPGDVVPYCAECFCTQSGYINFKYCSKSCSLYAKLNILQLVIKDSFSNDGLIDGNAIKKNKTETSCTPNSIYLEDFKYCLCPLSGDTRFKICVAMQEVVKNNKNNTQIKYNMSCEPLTFIEFDCNTCFCNKKGKIDPKWCTFDDCEAKKAVIENQKLYNENVSITIEVPENTSCMPGSIAKVGCNYCICPDNGKLKDKACTKNACSPDLKPYYNKLNCEPLTYFEVDCNICYCPRNGIKNVAKCTKKVCDNYLRSMDCTPGELFSSQCNLCICPPSGNKKETVCTNRSCEDSDDHWNTIFKLSQSLTVPVTPTRSRVLDLCFPGEEFPDGSKTCICPDMGLKVYAVCVDNYIDNPGTVQNKSYSGLDDAENDDDKLDDNDEGYFMKTEVQDSDCFTIDRRQISAYFIEGAQPLRPTLRNKPEQEESFPCKPGNMYILKCQQCMCPLNDNIYKYCRPLPKNFNCGEGLRRQDNNPLRAGHTDFPIENSENLTHFHTTYKCKNPGKLMDNCLICDCDGKTNEFILEHCFRSTSLECVHATPTFVEHKSKKSYFF